jgi:cell division protein FtsB
VLSNLRYLTQSFGPLLFVALMLSLALYFAFAAIQGDYGLFRRAEIRAETQGLQRQLSDIQAEVARMENLTKRLSDSYLDLDLLDEQARSILGLSRADDLVIEKE